MNDVIINSAEAKVSDQKQITILYIEDNLANQKLVERVLSRHNYRLLLADDGLTGMRIAMTESPNLILMDINLPDMNGKDVTAALKAKTQFGDVPIIALTADASEGNRSRALAVGCDGFITKPIDVSSFAKQIKGYLNGTKEILPLEYQKDTLKTYVGELVGDLESKVKELEAANLKLRKLDTAKSNFIQLVSHELRTPLTLLNGYRMLLADMIRKNPDIDEALPTISKGLDKGVDRLSVVIQEVLSVSKITAASLEVSKGPVRIAKELDTVIREFEDSCVERNISIAVEDLSSLPVIAADGTQLRVAFSNIIGNAIKFTPNGGSIRIFPVKANGSVTVAFQDYGPGIASAEHTSIFEAFYTLESISNHSTSKTQYLGGGLGLGLPIAKGIIEAHDGRIWVESDERCLEKMPGSIFYVMLPTLS
ncbi:MAG: response regulator [Anaerolineae bacterium]